MLDESVSRVDIVRKDGRVESYTKTQVERVTSYTPPNMKDVVTYYLITIPVPG